MDRDTFLGRVRAAIQTSDLPDVPARPPGGLVPDLPMDGLSEKFIERLEAVDGQAHQVANKQEAVLAVAGLLREYEALEYLAWDAQHLPITVDDLPGTALPASVAADAQGRLDHQTGYIDLLVGITGATVGLAESGSIVLQTGPGRPRMASLIPLVHIAVLQGQDISPSLSHWIADNPRAAAATSNLFVITGPSRTADIEQVLNLGVHGPKHLHVVVIA